MVGTNEIEAPPKSGSASMIVQQILLTVILPKLAKLLDKAVVQHLDVGALHA